MSFQPDRLVEGRTIHFDLEAEADEYMLDQTFDLTQDGIDASESEMSREYAYLDLWSSFVSSASWALNSIIPQVKEIDSLDQAPGHLALWEGETSEVHVSITSTGVHARLDVGFTREQADTILVERMSDHSEINSDTLYREYEALESRVRDEIYTELAEEADHLADAWFDQIGHCYTLYTRSGSTWRVTPDVAWGGSSYEALVAARERMCGGRSVMGAPQLVRPDHAYVLGINQHGVLKMYRREEGYADQFLPLVSAENAGPLITVIGHTAKPCVTREGTIHVYSWPDFRRYDVSSLPNVALTMHRLLRGERPSSARGLALRPNVMDLGMDD